MIALLIIPIAVLIALPFLTVASGSSNSSPKRILLLLVGGGFAAMGIATGHQLYWRATNDVPAIVWYVTGGIVGAILGTIVAAILLWVAAAVYSRSHRFVADRRDKH